MHRHLYYILLLTLLLFSTLSSCSDEDAAVPNTTLQYAISLSQPWREGSSFTRASSTRALDAPEVNYPEKVYVTATSKTNEADKKSYILSPEAETDPDTDGYKQYHTTTLDPPLVLADVEYFKFIAKSQYPLPTESEDIWTTIPPFGHTDYLLWQSDSVEPTDRHILITLSHQTSLVRFALSVAEKYAAIRTFRLKSLKVYKCNGVDADGKLTFGTEDADIIDQATISADGIDLTTDPEIFLSFHVKPDSEDFTTAPNLKTLKVVATYDVYDKGPKGDGQGAQLTRSNCTAQNTLTLPLTGSNALQIGKYYDIQVTLAPDFLYVLSDNDNESDLVLK